MMEKVRKIIKKEILEAFINADGKLQNIEFPVITDDSILYNFELGRAFAKNKLQKDIEELGTYELIDYQPKNEKEDAFLFEYETSYGENIVIEIIHRIDDVDNSYWNLIFSVARKGTEETPSKLFETGNIIDYKSFVNKVNEMYSKKISTAKY